MRKVYLREVPPPPEFDRERCNGCGLCVKVCAASVLEMRGDLPVVARGDFCFSCGHCAAVCPTGAVLHPISGVEGNLTAGSGPAVEPEGMQQFLRERRSIRFYKPGPLQRETLEKIISAGRYAPTGGNSQNVEYIVITKMSDITRLRKLTREFLVRSYRIVKNPIGAFYVRIVAGSKTLAQVREYEPGVMDVIERTRKGDDRILWHAPAVLLVHAPGWDPTSGFNCVAAIFHCALVAHSLGIGTCFNGFVEQSARHFPNMKKFLQIPKENKCFGAMTMGYPDVKFRRLVERREPTVAWR